MYDGPPWWRAISMESTVTSEQQFAAGAGRIVAACLLTAMLGLGVYLFKNPGFPGTINELVGAGAIVYGALGLAAVAIGYPVPRSLRTLRAASGVQLMSASALGYWEKADFFSAGCCAAAGLLFAASLAHHLRAGAREESTC